MVCDRHDANSSASGYNLKTFLQCTFWYFTTICRYIFNIWGILILQQYICCKMQVYVVADTDGKI